MNQHIFRLKKAGALFKSGLAGADHLRTTSKVHHKSRSFFYLFWASCSLKQRKTKKNAKSSWFRFDKGSNKKHFWASSKEKVQRGVIQARYGTPLDAVALLFIALEKKVPIISLLLGLNYLFHYPTWLHGFQNSTFSDKTYRNIVNSTIEKLADLDTVKNLATPFLFFSQIFNSGKYEGQIRQRAPFGRVGKAFFDNWHFSLQNIQTKRQQTAKCPLWWKQENPQLQVREAVRVRDGRICWLSGPAAGNVNDVAVIRNSGFLDFLLSDELVMADKLYISQEFDNFLTPKKETTKAKRPYSWKVARYEIPEQDSL